jgi:hypothetical protein
MDYPDPKPTVAPFAPTPQARLRGRSPIGGALRARTVKSVSKRETRSAVSEIVFDFEQILRKRTHFLDDRDSIRDRNVTYSHRGLRCRAPEEGPARGLGPPLRGYADRADCRRPYSRPVNQGVDYAASRLGARTDVPSPSPFAPAPDRSPRPHRRRKDQPGPSPRRRSHVVTSFADRGTSGRSGAGTT